MKKKLVLASKAALGVFLFSLLGICMIGAYATEGKTSALSAFGLILFGIAMAVSGILFLIQFVLEVRECWKEKGIWGVVCIPLQGILYTLVFMGVDFLMSKKAERMGSYVVYGITLMVTMGVINYWKRVKNQ